MLRFQSAISAFRREADEICALLGYYAARSGNLLPTFWNNYQYHLQGSRITFGFSLFGFFTLDYGTNGLSRNVGKKLPILAA